jgi:hypothetical protein
MQAPKVSTDDGDVSGYSSAMIPFHQTTLGAAQVRPFTIGLLLSFALVLTSLSFMGLGVIGLLAYVVLTFSLLGLVLCTRKVLRWRSVPLAVNINHPFVDEEPIGNSAVEIKFDEGWRTISQHRLKLTRDLLTGDWNLLKDDAELTVIGNWSKSSESEMRIDLGLVNQALALSDAVNEVADDFEQARKREDDDSGLLDRDWLDFEEIEIKSPLARIFSKDEQTE